MHDEMTDLDDRIAALQDMLTGVLERLATATNVAETRALIEHRQAVEITLEATRAARAAHLAQR